MKFFLMIAILFLIGCQNNSNTTEKSNFSTNDSLIVQDDKALTAKITAAEPGSILFETNKLLGLINVSDKCSFEYTEGTAPDKDIVGETNIMQADISDEEAKALIKLFYQKCHDEKLEKFSNDSAFWTDKKYNLKGFFNIADAKNSYFTCLIKSDHKYVYYALGNP